MLDDSFAEVFPPLEGLVVFGLVGLRVEDVGAAEVRPECFGDVGPSHQLMDCELFQELGFHWHERVAAILLYPVEKIGLFVVVRGQEDVVDDTLESLVGD